MLFDQAAGIIERHFPERRKMFDEARVFRLAGDSEGVALDKSGRPHVRLMDEAISGFDEEEREIENFRLPFPVVSFEKTGQRESSGLECCVLEMLNEATRRMRFVEVLRRDVNEFIVIDGVFSALPGASMCFGAADRLARFEEARGYQVSRDGCRSLKGSLQDLQVQSILPTNCIRVDEVLVELDKAGDDRTARERVFAAYGINVDEMNANIDSMEFQIGCQYAAMAVGSVLLVNAPSEFIVEERPLSCTGKIRNRDRILRSQHRPHYIVMKPREIKTRLLGLDDDGADPPAHSMRCPHERRGHYRRLSSEKFKAKRGHVLWIKPQWIGPQTAIKGKNRYTVLLDK